MADLIPGNYDPNAGQYNTPPPSMWDQMMSALFGQGGFTQSLGSLAQGSINSKTAAMRRGVLPQLGNVASAVAGPSSSGAGSLLFGAPPSVPSGAAVGSQSPMDMQQAGQAWQQGQQQQAPIDMNQAIAAGWRVDPSGIVFSPDGTPWMQTAGGLQPAVDPRAMELLKQAGLMQNTQQLGQNAVDLQNAQNQGTLGALGQQGQNAMNLQGLTNQGQLANTAQQGQNAFDLQGAQNAGQLATTALTTASQQAIAQLQNDTQQQLAALNADTSLTLSDKETRRTQIQADAQGQVAAINATGLQNAHLIDAELGKYTANLQAQEVQLQEGTKQAIANQQYDVAIRNIDSLHQIEHEKNVIAQEQVSLDRYKADLTARSAEKTTAANLLSTMMGLQSTERQARMKSAVDFFGQLAQMAPQQNLVNAFFTMRGQAPPPSIASQAMPLMNQILGPSSAGAAVQASGVNNSTFAPFLQDLMGVKAVPNAAPAAPAGAA